MITLRGGNGETGEVVGRCANGTPRPADSASPQVGFRCCMGEPNAARVTLSIERGKPLEQRGRVERTVAQKLEALLPDEVETALEAYGVWHAHALWDWRPINNARFLVAGGCAGSAPAGRCGVLVAELVSGQPQFMAWVWSGLWPPTVRVTSDSQKLWVYGGDRTSHIRQPVLFEWGRVRVGDMQRKFVPGSD
jgi:hypothetical protein